MPDVLRGTGSRGNDRSLESIANKAQAPDWTLDASSRELVRGNRRVRLAEKPFRVLEALVAAGGEVVTRDALRRRLWPDDTFVDFDNNLNSAVATLRQAFGDSARAPKYIETIPKVGYRLLLRPPAPAARSMRWIWAPAAAVVLLAAVLTAGASRACDRTSTGAPGAVSASRDARAQFERGVYLRGQFLAGGRDGAALAQALEAFEEAARLDSRFAAAHAERADTLLEMSFAGSLAFRDGLTRGRAAAQRALELDPDLPVAKRVLGLCALFLDWDFGTARVLIDAAAAAAPDARSALARATWLAAADRPAEAVTEAERAVALEPAAYFVRADLALFYLNAGRPEDAAVSAQHVLEVAPAFTPALSYALLAHERLGNWVRAARLARDLVVRAGATAEDLVRFDALDARAAVAFWRRYDFERLERQAGGQLGDAALPLALKHASLGNTAASMAALELALRGRTPLLVFIRAYPELAAFRGDLRFEAIARAVRG